VDVTEKSASSDVSGRPALSEAAFRPIAMTRWSCSSRKKGDLGRLAGMA